MAADSDSNIAWHRNQIKKHREALKNFESMMLTSTVLESTDCD
jgi:hypothetical protein